MGKTVWLKLRSTKLHAVESRSCMPSFDTIVTIQQRFSSDDICKYLI